MTVELYNLGCETQIQEKGTIVATALPKDYRKRSLEDKELSERLQHIQLRILSPLDVILTKLARFDEKDQVDITSILRTMKYPFKDIKRRFQQYLRLYPEKRKPEYTEKFERLRRLYNDVLT